MLRDKVNDARQMLHVTLCEAGYDKVANESTLAGMRAQYLMVNFRRWITPTQGLWTEALPYINSWLRRSNMNEPANGAEYIVHCPSRRALQSIK